MYDAYVALDTIVVEKSTFFDYIFAGRGRVHRNLTRFDLTSCKDNRLTKTWQFVSNVWKPPSVLAEIAYTLQQLGLNKPTKSAGGFTKAEDPNDTFQMFSASLPSSELRCHLVRTQILSLARDRAFVPPVAVGVRLECREDFFYLVHFEIQTGVSANSACALRCAQHAETPISNLNLLTFFYETWQMNSTGESFSLSRSSFFIFSHCAKKFYATLLGF
jgi:hypothetical protein